MRSSPSAKLTGVQADLSVHNPSVSNQQFSAGGVHIQSMTEAINQTDSIKTGWMVSDTLNNYISCVIKRLINQLALLISSILIFFVFNSLSFIYICQLSIGTTIVTWGWGHSNSCIC